MLKNESRLFGFVQQIGISLCQNPNEFILFIRGKSIKQGLLHALGNLFSTEIKAFSFWGCCQDLLSQVGRMLKPFD